MFSDARNKLDQNKQEKNRKPSQLPLEEDLKKICEFTLKSIKNYTSLDYLDTNEYVALRNSVCCRLTLLNARRGGEAARLLLKEWKDGEKGKWLDTQRMSDLERHEMELFQNLNLCYQMGKGKKLVPLLIPAECKGAISVIISNENRTKCNISLDNPFVFAPTGSNNPGNNFHNHISGWHIIKSVCSQLKLKNANIITATKNRHRIST